MHLIIRSLIVTNIEIFRYIPTGKVRTSLRTYRIFGGAVSFQSGSLGESLKRAEIQMQKFKASPSTPISFKCSSKGPFCLSTFELIRVVSHREDSPYSSTRSCLLTSRFQLPRHPPRLRSVTRLTYSYDFPRVSLAESPSFLPRFPPQMLLAIKLITRHL